MPCLCCRKMCCLNGSRKLLTQKIRLDRFKIVSGWIFCAFAQFFAGIGPAHFLAETTRPLGRGCLPFSPSFSRCKVTKKKFGTVRICPHMSGNVRFCPHFFYAAKLRKEKLALSSFVQLCPFVSIYVQLRHSNVS